MTHSKPIVFISCGQITEAERELGKRVSSLVDELTPFAGYFAQNQATLKTLSENVLRKLFESVGFIAVMHHRGRIEGRSTIRGSVWVEQEVAIATLMEQVLHRPLHVALFVEKGIAIEGLRQQIQLNPIEFSSAEDVTEHLRSLLCDWKEPLYTANEELWRNVQSGLVMQIDSGYISTVTANITNRSRFDLEIRTVNLWNGDRRICKPIFPRQGQRWLVRANGCTRILFESDDNIIQRLASMHPAKAGEDLFRRRFPVDLSIEAHCEVMGRERIFKETTAVQVDYGNNQIMGL